MEEAKEKSETGSVQVSSPQKSNVKNTHNEDSRRNNEVTWNVDCDVSSKSNKDVKAAPIHSKKVIKHALRQQAKRRRKNTTIAAGNSAPIQRISLSPHCEIEEISNETACYRQPTMAEVLASIPGFSVKPRKRSNKKLSAAAQIEQTKEGCIDLETPDSILVNSNLRSLLNKHTFHSLPPLYQYKLLQLLPHVDRVPFQSESMFRLSNSGLNNEFFARACLDWRERLAEGEFTVENQAKLKAEQEKEKSKLDPWKLKHFEPMWGESLREWPSLPPGILATAPNSTPKVAATNPPVANSVTTKVGNDVKAKQVKAVAKTNTQNEQKPPPPILRTVGAVTRAVTSYREKRLAEESNTNQVRPIKRNRQEDTTKEEEKEKVEEAEKTANESDETILETIQEENRVNEESEKQNDDISYEERSNLSEENMNEVVVISTDHTQKDETDELETNLDKIEEDQIQIVEFEQNIVEEVVRNVVEEVIQMKEDAVDNFKDLEDQTAEEKTLGDLVALEEEVADRIELSVKAEALQKASLEEWEIIKVDPNQEGESSSGLPTPGGSNEIMASTSSEDSNKNHNYYNDILYQETLKEDEAALLAAAWDVVGSSSEFQNVNLNQPVSVIPCQEELEVRLQESSLPVPQWDYSSSENKQSHGHVKLELEVTLTPEVDSQVSSTVEQLPSIGNLTNSESCSPVVSSGETGTRTSIPLIVEDTRTSMSTETVIIQQAPHVNVIPPTTIVCLPPPPLFSTQATPAAPPIRPPQNHNSSSSALPFIALTTSTPVRALSTKTVSKGATGTNRGGGGRNSNKPPPGAVNLERSYQICQAVIQNSPNRHQLRCQLKPPPSLLISKSSSTSGSSNTNSRVTTGNSGSIRQVVRQGIRQTQQHQVLLKHVFTSSHGIPVNMAVLPSQHNQMGEYMMVQRGVQVRRSNSAPPSNMEPGAASGLAHRGGRPASVGGPRPPSSESAPPPPPPPLPAPPLPPPSSYHHLVLPQQNSTSCPCSLKAMIACIKCGAFCHDDCITPHSRLCITCDTR